MARPVDISDHGWMRPNELVSHAVRSLVAGPNADRRAEELWSAPGERWFGGDRPIRVVHTDVSMFVGGLRALMLQTLHPLAMAGVAQHSDYRRDPWGRLQRTADFLAATSFGPVEEAERAVARVKHVHQFVTGIAPDGRSYSAGDPELLAWVHLCEVESFLEAHRRFGATTLDAQGYDGYVADMAVIAVRLGVIDPPTTVAEMNGQMRRMRPRLRPSPQAREAIRFLVTGPALPLPARPLYGAISAAAISLLPVWSRLALRLPWLPVTEQIVVRPAAGVLLGALRWATPSSTIPTQ